MTTIEDYIVLRNKIDAYLNEKEKNKIVQMRKMNKLAVVYVTRVIIFL